MKLAQVCVLAVMLVMLMLTVGCSGNGDDESAVPITATRPPPPTLPPIATRAPQPSPTPVNAYPAGTRTNIDVIDGVLEALEGRDAAALVDRLSFHPYRCDNAPAGVAGSNRCPPGVPEGSPVDVIAVGDCEVEFLARERAELVVEVEAYVDAASDQRLYAVAEVQEGRLASPLPLRYVVILSQGYSLLLDEAGVTHLGLPCGNVGPAQLYHPADRPILAPL